MPLLGDLRKFAGHAKAMVQMARGALIKRESGLLEEARVALRDKTAECFLMQRAPDGAPWAMRKTVYGHGRDGNPILFPILDYLRFEIAYESTAAFLRRAGSAIKVVVPPGKEYVWFHIKGTWKMVARPFLPTAQSVKQKILLAGVRAAKRVMGI